MTLIEVLYQMMEQSQRASQPSDLVIGTVTAVGPLEVTVDESAPPLKSEVLLLTEPVIEKKIPVLTHSHEIDGLSHTHTVTGLGHSHSTGGFSHTHTVGGLSHSHDTAGLSHTHSTADGATGSALDGAYSSETALGGDYTSSSALAGSYPSDTQLAGTYSTQGALGDVQSGGALENVACIENGRALPVENGYIILNRALEVGDAVLMLRVQHGQRFIILSRIFKEAA